MRREIEFSYPPKRIISLVPSQTEFLFDVGLDNEIVGVTRFCIHPKDKVATKEKVGGTKQFNIEKIKALNPDLIIGNKEENYEEGITELSKYFPVWMSDITSIEDAYAMMDAIGSLTGKTAEAREIKQLVENGLKSGADKPSLTAAYFIWRKPYMVAASGTFIDAMLGVFGVRNAFGHLDRYPKIAPSLISEVKPDFVFLSSEPYSFKETHFEEFQSFYPAAKVVLVDGEMFSWYGSRLKYAGKYFKQLRGQLSMPLSG